MAAETQKSIVFDTGPVISLALNDILWLLEPLKKKFGGRFLITSVVKRELVDRPFEGKKFKFEALRVLSEINNNVLEIVEMEQITAKARYLMDMANKTFMAKGNFMQIVHSGEIEALAAAIVLGSSAFVVDERTTRMLIENPEKLKDMMENKLHMKIEINRKNLADFSREAKGIKLIRSTELAVVAYDLGLLDKYLPKTDDADRQLLDSVLWGIKLNGCSVSEREIETIVKVETKGKR